MTGDNAHATLGEEGAEGDGSGAPEGAEENKGPSDEIKKTSVEDATMAAQNAADMKTLGT